MKLKDRDKVRDIIKEWEDITESREGQDGLRNIILKSWERCSNYNLELENLNYEILPPEELEILKLENQDLLEASRPYLRRLNNSLSRIPHVLAIADKEGWVLEILGDIEKFGGRETGICCGSNWSEEFMGTNGVGTVLVEEEPVLIYGIEHFVRVYKPAACFGVPIRDSSDNIIGVFDLSVPIEYAYPDRLLFALMTVENIEHDFDSTENLTEENTDTLFINMMHELNTPLSTIFTVLETLKGVTEENNPYLKVLERGAYRLLKLAENSLDVGKIEKGQYEFERSNVVIARKVSEVIEEVSDFIEYRNIELKIEDRLKKKKVACDVSAFKRILLNLLSNAVKATKEQGRITVHLKKTGNEIALVVEDDGQGIPYEDQEKIFEKYYRCEKTLSRLNEGSGLGLYLVKKLVEYHEGRIELTSTPGRGSKITILLPDIRLDNSGAEAGGYKEKLLNTVSSYKKEFSDIYI